MSHELERLSESKVVRWSAERPFTVLEHTRKNLERDRVGVKVFDDVDITLTKIWLEGKKVNINGFLFVPDGYFTQALPERYRNNPRLEYALLCALTSLPTDEDREVYGLNFSVKSGIMQSTGAELYYKGKIRRHEDKIHNKSGFFVPVTATFHSAIPLSNYDPGLTFSFGKFFIENEKRLLTGSALTNIAPTILNVDASAIDPHTQRYDVPTYWYDTLLTSSAMGRGNFAPLGLAVPLTEFFTINAHTLDLGIISSIKSKDRHILDQTLGITKYVNHGSDTRGKYFLAQTGPLRFPTGYIGIVKFWTVISQIGGFSYEHHQTDYGFDTVHLASVILGDRFPLNADEGGVAPIRGEYRIDQMPDNMMFTMPFPTHMVIQVYRNGWSL